MNKTIRKNIIFRVLLGLMLFLLIGFTTISATSDNTALAAEKATPKYLVHFAYTATKTSNSISTVVGSSTDTTSCSAQIGQNTSVPFKIYMWGSGQSGTGELVNGGYINSSTINISVETSCSPTISVKNNSGSVLQTGTKTISVSNLADGTYNVLVGASEGWRVNSRQYDTAGISITFGFKIDTGNPTVSGGSTSADGKYTNAAFTITSSDGSSGIQSLYMKGPQDSGYNSVGASAKTVAASATNGLYSFYAKDKAGNTSETQYVYLDTSKPTISLSPNKTYTNSAFSASASDTGSGISYVQYTTPTNSSWTTYTSGKSIAATSANGKYTFRAGDNAGNVSSEYAIYLDTTKPTGTLYSETTAKTNDSKVNGAYVKFIGGDTLSGVDKCYIQTPGANSFTTYTSGSQYTTEGTYSFYCTDKAGNTSDTYKITLDKTKPVGTIKNASGVALTGTYTNVNFSYSATDSGTSIAKLECKMPTDADWKTYSASTIISSAATNGLYQFRATDGAGNVSDVKSITLDSAKPTGQVYGGTTALSSGSYTNAGSVKFVTSDALSGLRATYVKVPGVTDYTAYVSGLAYSAEGKYYFYSVDNAGNTSSTYSILLDNTKPTVIIANGDKTVSDAYVNYSFKVSASDLTSDIKKMQYMRPKDTAWQDFTANTTIEKTAGDGKYSFRAEDNAGNISEVRIVTLDITKPIVTIYGGTTVIANGGNTNATDVSFSATDDGSGIKQMFVKLPSSTSYATYKTGTKFSYNGKYSFYCTDNAGNTSATYIVTFDSSVPTGSIKDGAGSVLTSAFTNKSFSYSATDSGVGIDKLQYTTPSNSAWTTYTSGTIISTTADNGKYQFRAIDKAGNTSAVSSITLDTTKPTGTIYGGDTVLENGKITNAGYVKFTPEDNLSGVSKTYVKLPTAVKYEEYTSGSQLTENGSYSFYCEDKAGNTSITYTVIIDNIAPTLTCSQTNFYDEYDDTFTVSMSETLSSASLYYKTTVMTSYEKATGSSYTVKDTEPNGKYYFYASDEAGNVSPIYWIELNVIYPTATIVTDKESNVIYITWDDDSVGQLNGVLYLKNTKITKEGDYTFTLTSKKNRTSTYTFTLSHSYYVDEVIDPDCTEQGYSIYRCLSCDSYYHSDYVNALGHAYEETTVTATCTTEGGVYHTCSRCGDEYVTDVVTPFGHNYFEYTLQPTCTDDGCVRHECSLCGYTYDTEIVKATGHDYLTEVARAATCTEEGERTHICGRCGNSYTTAIPAFGHTYEITDVEEEGGVTRRTYTCEICGDTYVQDLGNQYEEVSNYVEYLFQQYRPYMFYVFLGTAGVWSIAMGIAIIIARKNDEKEKAKKMLVNYGIGMIIIFAILIAVPYLVRGIAALIAE